MPALRSDDREMGRAVVRTRLLTVAGELSAIGGTEVAQLRIMEGLASRDGTSNCCTSVGVTFGRAGTNWPRAPGPFGLQACGEPLLSGAASGRSARRLASCAVMPRSSTCTSPGDLPSGLMASRVKRTPGGAAPPPTPSISPAGVDEPAHPPGRRRDHPLVRCSSPMDTGSRAGERPGVGDPHRDRHRALRSHCRRRPCRATSGPRYRPRRPHDSLRGPN